MNRADAWQYVAYAVDDSLNTYDASNRPEPNERIRLVGWQCGFEPMFVAVFSYLPNVRLDDDDAADLAMDLLKEKGWFNGPSREPDYIL